uniref:Uncharacterized protein n=1 Tax=Branchiostoma floridae TaxID=7739 RepID=C3XQP0_BRAFL|eukprot:XP_002613607.1 hypothetical protein BRAFLDRAFT_93650 [Branchiostoma floridae]
MAAAGSYLAIFEFSRLNCQTYLVFCIAFLLACLYLRRSRNLPPYPAGRVPVLGHLLALGRAPHLQLTAWRRQYGDVFTVRIGMQDVVVLNGYTAVKDAMVDRSELFASRPPNYIPDLLTGFGKDIVGTRWGQEFKQKKRFATTVLKTLGMKVGKGSIEEKIQEEGRSLCERFAAYQGRPFDAERDLQVTIANVICAMAFGHRFAYGDERFAEMAEAIVSVQMNLASLSGQLISVFPFLRFVPGEATVMEVQRVRTTVPMGLPHATTQHVKLGQFDLPAGTQVLTNLYSLHTDPAYWPDPDRFDPDRFLDGEGHVIGKPHSFMPFSGGRRVCLGEQLAKMELILLFCGLMQNFTFKLPEGAPPVSTGGILRISLTPHPHNICAIPR